jgi:outer membrane protein assembly factor BamE (lipoprotein component of BamABCDE complex)
LCDYVFHNDKRQANAKEEVFVPPPEQLKETKVWQYVFHNNKRQAKEKEEVFVKETKVVFNALHTL